MVCGYLFCSEHFREDLPMCRIDASVDYNRAFCNGVEAIRERSSLILFRPLLPGFGRIRLNIIEVTRLWQEARLEGQAANSDFGRLAI